MKNTSLSRLAFLCLSVSFYWSMASMAKAQSAWPFGQSGSQPAKLQSKLLNDPNFFPVAVWLQSARHAAEYKAAGFNLYVALSDDMGPAPLAELQKAGMSLICQQDEFTLKNKTNPTIVGWMHGDEPDNAQEIPGKKGYGPPITPQKIVNEYNQMRAADPTHPIMLNLGVGVSWKSYIGRGVRTGHQEDYPEYIKGADIVSFDIYPVTETSPEVAGKLEFVPQGVDNLIKWSNGQKPVWACIGCTHIGNPSVKPTPEQVRSEVWMSIIHGARGLIYFSHEFKPAFKEAAILADPEMLAAITRINQQIQSLAPVLNSPNVTGRASVTASQEGEISSMVKQGKDGLYVFTVNMRNTPAHGSVALQGAAATQAEVLGESRQIPVQAGKFEDDYKPYEVHLYKISGAQ